MKVRWRRYRRGEPTPLGKLILRVVLIASVATMILPFLWMVSTALKDERSFQIDPSSWLPHIAPYQAKGALGIDYVRVSTPDFEDVLLEDFETARAGQVTDVSASRAGEAGLLLPYDFAKGKSDSETFTVPLAAPAAPGLVTPLLTFWLKGDGSGHDVRVRLRGEGFQYESDAALSINFEGWKEVYCFFRPETFDSIGRVIVPMRPVAGQAQPVAVAGIRSMSLEIDPVSRPMQIFGRLSDSFVKAWQSMPFGRFYLNSLFVAIAVTIGQVLTSALAAYAFSRLEFPGRDKLFLGYLATMMIPGAVLLVPTFLLMRWLDWFDSYKALIVPAMFSAYGTFLLRQFFMTLPRDLEDAARIDGCGKLRVWYHVILPLSRPALATLATFTFLGTWESFQWPLFVTKSMDMGVLPVALSRFQDKFAVQYNLLMAAALITTVPTLLVFLFNQRFFTKGITMTGMKE